MKDILALHQRVVDIQRHRQQIELSLQQREKEIDFLRWKLCASESVNLALRHSEYGWQQLCETACHLLRTRVIFGNMCLAETSDTFVQSVGALRSELQSLRDDAAVVSADRDAWKAKCAASQRSLADASETIQQLTRKAAELQRSVVTEGLSDHFNDELRMRDELIATLRSHNAELMTILRLGKSNDGNSSALGSSRHYGKATSHSPEQARHGGDSTNGGIVRPTRVVAPSSVADLSQSPTPLPPRLEEPRLASVLGQALRSPLGQNKQRVVANFQSAWMVQR